MNEVCETDANQPGSFRLILHVGAGKTGTSSIQETLRVNSDSLKAKGIWYLGLMLEHSPVREFLWQIAGGYPILCGQESEVVTSQFVSAIDSALNAIKLKGFHTAIISNEAIFHKIIPIHNAIRILCDRGWKIEVVAYVRRHDAWVKSAYIQWGLKHKSYPGALRSFKEWKNNAPYKFSDSLNAWASIEKVDFFVRNADQAGDVVNDFLSLCGVSIQEVMVEKTNLQPSSEELLLRALYNKLSQIEVLPQEFDQIMGVNDVSFDLSATSFLEEYLPTDEDIRKHLDDCALDIQNVNQMLMSTGQFSLSLTPKSNGNKDVDLGKLVATLAMMLMVQAKKLQNLQNVVNTLGRE